MFRLGVRLTLRGGREALVRLALIAAAVAIGVTVLLAVLAEFHGFQTTNGRQCWECTTGAAPSNAAATGATVPGQELWNYRQDYYEGQTIERLDVAALGPGAPVVPGTSRVPAAGEYFASPAMARLLASVPADELADRFPGKLIGTIGDQALSGPEELAIIVGGSPQQLAALPATKQVSAISTASPLNSATNLYQFGFGVAAIGLIFPLLTLIGTATRLAAARREERFAAFRLVGGTPRQVAVIASVDAVIGALIGAVVGMGIFQLVKPALGDIAISGSRYFGYLVAPTAAEYVGILLGVPLAAALAALWSLQRVQISPLGVTRRTTPRPPGVWRLLPLVLGLVLFTIAPLVLSGSSDQNTSSDSGLPTGPSTTALPFTLLGLLLIMLGLVMSGSWLTMQVSRLMARTARGASGVLSARRLADNPKAAFRSISGLVLAVFVGSVIAGVIPAIDSGMQGAGGGTLDNVLRATFQPTPNPAAATQSLGLSAANGAQLLGKLSSYPGAAVLPIYAASAQDSGFGCVTDNECAPTSGVIPCPALANFPALGTCAGGVATVQADFGFLLSADDPTSVQLPFVDATAPPAGAATGGLAMEAVLIRTGDAATLEKIRTLLTGYSAQSGATSAPRTFGEGIATRAAVYNEIQKVTFAVVVVTLLVAGCSLAVAVGGGLLERKRPFTLLRLTGTPTPTLYRVIVFESVLPLAGATVVAALVGFGTAASIAKTLARNGASVAAPGHVYFLTLGGGLLASLAVISTALPLLRRITDPDNARFE